MGGRSRMRRRRCLGVAAMLALAVAGCGGAGTKSERDVANVPGEATDEDGRLSAVPRPLRLADLRRERPGSPQGVVLRLLYFAQWGSAPNIARAYDPAVRRAVGISNIVGTYSQQRGVLATSRPRFLERTATASGTFIGLELLRADAPPARYSFSLRRRAGQWRIVFDTLLESGLDAYVSAMRSRNPVGRPPDRLAARRGREAAQTYRGLFASTLDR